MADSDISDIEIKKVSPKKPVKQPPKSPTVDFLKKEKKVSTRAMIHHALNDLKTRKGVSSYAIKKFLEEKYEVNPEKIKYLIKKTLKSGVEDGSIIQVKGIGASGSFKLANVKEKPKKLKTKKDEKSEGVKEKPKKENMSEKLKEKVKAKQEGKKVKMAKKEAMKSEKVPKSNPPKETKRKGSKSEDKEVKEVKAKIKGKAKITTPAKKKASIMKRKSIASIIKKPKMKPKMKV